MPRLVEILIALVGLALAGCVTSPAPLPLYTPLASSGEKPATFDYGHLPVAYGNHDLPEQDSRHYRVKRITFSSHGDNGQPGNRVTARYYQGRQPLTGRFGWTVPEYRQRVAARIAHLDPSHYSRFVDPSEIFMIDACYDDCMPREARDALWESLGQPRRMSFLAAHKTAFLYMTPLAGNYMRGEIYRFLEARLGAPGREV